MSGEDKRPPRQTFVYASEQRRDAMRVVTTVLALAVSLVMVGKLMAADKACPATKPQRHAMAGPWDVVKDLNLTSDQKTAVEALKKEYGPKLKEVHQKVEGILTPEQKKARAEALKAANAAGKKGPDLHKAVVAAVKLTDDQKSQMDAARKDVQALQKEVRGKLMAILTPEQKNQLKQQMQKHREHKA